MVHCFLIEEQYGKRTVEGYFRYPEKDFKIAYTDEAKAAIKVVVAEMLSCKKTNGELHCKHQ